MSLRPFSLLAFAALVAGCASLGTQNVNDAPGFQELDRPGFRQRRDIRPSQRTPTFGTGFHSDNYG